MAGMLFALLFNSCKKDDQASFRSNLTSQPWLLASLQVTTFQRYKTSTTDTLRVSCGGNPQTLNFKADGAASYSGFQCNNPDASGTWSYDTSLMQLHMNLPLKDTTSKTGNNQPFAIAQVITLGRSSLVIRTGDLNSYYADDLKHKVYRYSFIHQGQ